MLSLAIEDDEDGLFLDTVTGFFGGAFKVLKAAKVDLVIGPFGTWTLDALTGLLVGLPRSDLADPAAATPLPTVCVCPSRSCRMALRNEAISVLPVRGDPVALSSLWTVPVPDDGRANDTRR